MAPMSTTPRPDPRPSRRDPTAADWSRWESLARSVRAHAGPAGIVPGGVAEARSFAGMLASGTLTLARWREVARDGLAAHLIAATLASLKADSIAALDPDERAALGRLLTRQLAALDRLGDQVRSGVQLLDNSFLDRAAALVATARLVARYVGLGRAAKVTRADVEDAAAWWRRVAPDWAKGLIDAT